MSSESVASCSHWKGVLSGEELLAVAAKVDSDAWKLQRDAGIDLVALDGTLYDQAGPLLGLAHTAV